MSVGSSTLSGAASGAALGSVAGPWGVAIGGVVGAGAGLVMGLSDKKKRDKAAALAKQRPVYTIPKEVYANKAKLEAWSKDPRAAGFNIAENQIGQSQAAALRSTQQGAGSSADALSQVGDIQKNTQNQYGQLAAMGAQQQRSYRSELLGANNDLAAYKDMKFDVNQMQPYRTNFEQNQKLQDQNRMDNQNMVNDVQSLAASGTSAMGGVNTRKKTRQSTPSIQQVPYSPLAPNSNYQYSGGNSNSIYNF